MNKKGLGHIEVILAFVLFIGFLIFGLYFFNPLNSTRVLDSSLYYAKDAVYDNVTSKEVSYSIALRDVQEDKITFPLDKGSAEGDGIYVEDLEGTTLEASYDSGQVSIDRESGSDFITVRYGDFFPSSNVVTGAQTLDDQEFSIASSEAKDILSEKRIITLNQTYYEGYESLKKQFNLPGRVEFSFSVVFSPDDGIYASQPVPENAEVFSETYREEILRKDGTIIFADVTVRTW